MNRQGKIKTSGAIPRSTTRATVRAMVSSLRFSGAPALRVQALVFILALLLVSAGGCGTKSKTRAGTVESAPASLTIRGSNTMLPLLTALAEAYEKVHAGTQVSVTDGGSSVGIDALINGTVDLCMSSRELSAEEREKGEFRRIPLEGVVVSLDGVSTIVNPRKKDAASNAVSPSPATIGDGSYVLERPLYIYASGEASSLAMSFLEYVLSQEGQRIVREKGYVPV